jgi:hypothetical protein
LASQCQVGVERRDNWKVGADAGVPPKREPRSREREGGSNSVVESQPSKLLVAGSIPVSRSSLRSLRELRLGWPVKKEDRRAFTDY